MTTTTLLDLDRLERELPALASAYLAAAPFEHVVLDDVLTTEVAELAAKEHEAVPDYAWHAYVHLNERKFANGDQDHWGPTLRGVAEVLNGERFIGFLERLTGIEGLRPDPSLDGSGLHRSLRGGFLNVHTDFTVHHKDPSLHRRINLLLYLNPGWDPAWGGALELWAGDMSRCVTSIEPRGNRLVIFNTTDSAYHGHPEPLRCPPDVARRSLALYYFTVDTGVPVRSTTYRARPGDGLRRVGIFLDSHALHTYDRVKRRLRLNDSLVWRVLGPLGRRGRG